MIRVYEADDDIVDSVYQYAKDNGYDDVNYDNVVAAYNMASNIAKNLSTTVSPEEFPVGFAIDISKLDIRDIDKFYNAYASNKDAEIAEHYDYYKLVVPFPNGGKYSRIYLSYENGSTGNQAGVSVGELT